MLHCLIADLHSLTLANISCWGWGIARAQYSTTLLHLQYYLVIVFLISHVYYICDFLLSMYGHQGNAGTSSHVIF